MKIFGIPLPFTKRSDPVADDRLFSELVNWHNSAAGVTVTPETALTFTAVYAAVKVISETVASVPLITYERMNDDSRRRAVKNPVYRLLKSTPNRYQTSFEFRETLTAHVALRGNGYARIKRNGRGEPSELIILHPSRVEPYEHEGEIFYKVTLKDGTFDVLPKRDVFHLKAYSDSGLKGSSPISVAANAVGLGLAAEKYESNFIGNSASPAGILSYKGKLPKESKDKVRQDWKVMFGNHGSKREPVAVLDENMTWQQVGISQEDAQLLLTRKFQIEEIARIYRIPLHLLGDLSRATFSNIEHQGQEFITYTMMPWFRRWEEAIDRDLINEKDTDNIYAEFILDSFLRGDALTRATVHSIGRQWGWKSANDVLRIENQNPIGDQGNIYLVPMNMIPADKIDQVLENKQEDDGDGEEKEPTEPAEKKSLLTPQVDHAEAFRGAFQETWERIVRKEIGTVRTAARKCRTPGEFPAWFDKFADEQRTFAEACLLQLAVTYDAVTGGTGAALRVKNVVGEYLDGVKAEVRRFQENPEEGYRRDESEVCLFLTNKVLSYDGGEYGNAA